MTVTASGIYSTQLEAMAELLSASTTLRTEHGAASQAALLAEIERPEADDREGVVLPRTIVDTGDAFSSQKIGTGSHALAGTLLVSFQFAPLAESTLAEEKIDFLNKVGAIISECRAIAGHAAGKEMIVVYTADFGEWYLEDGNESSRVAYNANAATIKAAAEAAYPDGGTCTVSVAVSGSTRTASMTFANWIAYFNPAPVDLARGELLPLGVNAPCSPTLEYTDIGTDEPDFDPWIAELDTDGANVGWLGVGPLENQIENDDQSKGLEGAVADPADEIAWVGDSGGTELEDALQVDLAVTKADGVYAIVNGAGGQVPVERREIPVVLGTLYKIAAVSDWSVTGVRQYLNALNWSQTDLGFSDPQAENGLRFLSATFLVAWEG